MLGLLLALLSSIVFAISNVYIRQGVGRAGESYSPVPISLFFGIVVFAVPLFISGEIRELTSFSSLALGSIAGAGIVHFIFGRTLAYIGIRLIGANRSSPIHTGSILVTTILGIVFFKEALTIYLVLGFIFITSGVLIISSTVYTVKKEEKSADSTLFKGVLAAFGAALCWGVSPVLIKIGFAEGVSPLPAIFVSYVASSFVVSFSLFHRKNIEKIRKLNRYSLIPIIVGTVAVTIAQLLRYVAFKYSPISLVAPIVGTSSIFVFPLSFFINRSIEAFGVRIIMGIFATVAGIFFIFWIA